MSYEVLVLVFLSILSKDRVIQKAKCFKCIDIPLATFNAKRVKNKDRTDDDDVSSASVQKVAIIFLTIL